MPLNSGVIGDLAVRSGGSILGLDGSNVFISGRGLISVLIPSPCFKRYLRPGMTPVKFSGDVILSGQFTITSKGPSGVPVPN